MLFEVGRDRQDKWDPIQRGRDAWTVTTTTEEGLVLGLMEWRVGIWHGDVVCGGRGVSIDCISGEHGGPD